MSDENEEQVPQEQEVEEQPPETEQFPETTENEEHQTETENEIHQTKSVEINKTASTASGTKMIRKSLIEVQKSANRMETIEERVEGTKSAEMIAKKTESGGFPLKKLDTSPSLTRHGAKSESKTVVYQKSEQDTRKSRVDRRSSRAKMALGSIIDIRKSMLIGDVYDRKAARFMNTYKLESDNPFNPEKVHKILEVVMMEAMENLTYDPEKCPKQAIWASLAIRGKVKELEFDRYKIVCIVTIGEKNSQDVLATCRFLWDSEKDRYACFSMENTYVFGYAQCFGLYYE